MDLTDRITYWRLEIGTLFSIIRALPVIAGFFLSGEFMVLFARGTHLLVVNCGGGRIVEVWSDRL